MSHIVSLCWVSLLYLTSNFSIVILIVAIVIVVVSSIYLSQLNSMKMFPPKFRGTRRLPEWEHPKNNKSSSGRTRRSARLPHLHLQTGRAGRLQPPRLRAPGGRQQRLRRPRRHVLGHLLPRQGVSLIEPFLKSLTLRKEWEGSVRLTYMY